VKVQFLGAHNCESATTRLASILVDDILALDAGGLSSSLLKEELLAFQKLKGYLPQVLLVHMNPRQEKEIETEVKQLSRELGTPITLAYEGLAVQL